MITQQQPYRCGWGLGEFEAKPIIVNSTAKLRYLPLSVSNGGDLIHHQKVNKQSFILIAEVSFLCYEYFKQALN